MKKTLLFLLFTLLGVVQSFAYDAEIKGIYYNFYTTAAEVTYMSAENDYESNSMAYSGSITIPETVEYNGKTYFVTSIVDHAFYGCSGLTSVTIPNSVTFIDDHAFYGCSGLTSVNIPNSVDYIGEQAFYGCSSLTSVSIPNSVISIREYTFYGCSGLTSVTIPNSVTYIGEQAFSGCSSLTSVTIPNSVTYIGQQAFQSCSNLVSVVISNSVESIYFRSFADCSALTSIIIPSSVTSIGSYAFAGCSELTTVEFPKALRTIGEYAFNDCQKLETMTLPSSISTLGEKFVSHCKNLYAPFERVVETDISMVGKLHVPLDAANIFRENGWDVTSIVGDIDMDFVYASGTYEKVKWEIWRETFKLFPASSNGTPKMTAAYDEYGNGQAYPWDEFYSYLYRVKHVVIEGLASLGEECLAHVGSYNLETLTTNTTTVNMANDQSTQELFYCFDKKYDRKVSYTNFDVEYYNFKVPSTLSKIIYTGNTFSINYFTGDERILRQKRNYSNNQYISANEFHPTNPLEIHAENVTEIKVSYTKALKNTKLYLTYTGEAKSGMLADLGDLYSLTINSTGVATENGVFFTLFGNARENADMMYGGGGYYIPLGLKELHLMEGVTSIPQACFKNVTSLEKVYLPSTLRGVQDNAFLNCDGLTDIYVNAAMPPSAKDNSFEGVNIFLCTLHVPYDSKQYYSVAKGWKDFYTIDNDADIRITVVKNIENAGQIIGSTSYMKGETTNITAVANGGYKFFEWTDEEGNHISDNAVLSVVATASCVYRAIFVPLSNTGAVVCSSNSNEVTLNWETNPQVTHYEIYLYISPDMEDIIKIIIVDAEGRPITRATNDTFNVGISDLECGTNYYYRIVGYDADDNILDVYIGSFETSVESAVTGISEEDTISGMYNIHGQKIEQVARGFNIVQTKNGKVRKIIK